MRGSASTPPLLAILVAATACVDGGCAHLYAAGEFFIDGGVYSFGTLRLSSPTSARDVDKTHSWTPADLPGMKMDYCGPVIAGDRGVVYAFAGSGCVEDNGFAPAAILAYNLTSKTTTVHGGVPKAVYEQDKSAATGPIFGTPFLDESRGVFYVVTASHVAEYDFELWMLLEFNPRSGK